jgi:hypothetical protein
MTVDVDGLIELVRQQRRTVLPFVGSGLALDAGAPDVRELARRLVVRCDLPSEEAERSLPEVVATAQQTLGVPEVQVRLADIVAGWRLRPTPALTAVAGAATRVVVTTNYDDAIEVAARDRGLEATSLLRTDKRILDRPEDPGCLHVVHIHGIPSQPDSLVLPGPTTNRLVGEQPFGTFLRAILARHTVVYLGFSLSPAELHLRAMTAWLADHVEDPRRQYLLVGKRAREKRAEDLALLDQDVVSVVTYADDQGHTAV